MIGYSSQRDKEVYPFVA